MPPPIRTVRVFVSSTFRDMHAERDHLNRHVFPELRQRCLARGVEFVAVDLRWGLTEEQTNQQGALRLCLEEVDRCRPFFLALVGDRYGWVPPPEEISQRFFELARGRDDLRDKDRELLDIWYELDTTSTPPRYRLRRDRPNELNRVATRLVALWSRVGLPEAHLSVTVREIRRAVTENRFAHCLCYLRQAGPGGITTHPDFPAPLRGTFEESEPTWQRLAESLKKNLRDRRGREGVQVREYPAEYAGLRIDPALLPAGLTDGERLALADGVIEAAEWKQLGPAVRASLEQHGTVSLDGMEQFGQWVLEDLWQAIETELGCAPARPAPDDARESQRAGHERFVRDRTRLFIGRRGQLDRLHAYRNTQSSSPLAVVGPAGSGKSALLARFVVESREQAPGSLVIPHFIGAAPDTTRLTSTLRSLLETLRRAAGAGETLTADPNQLRSLLPQYLERAAASRPVLLVLDAVNQLDPSERSHSLDWLPACLPKGVRLVVSTLPGDCAEVLRRRTNADHWVEVTDLSADERRQLVREHLQLRGKTLTDSQLQALLDVDARPEARLPLYLLVALEELCLFGSFEALNLRLHRLPATVEKLFNQVLLRLEADHERELVELACGALAVARSGLAEAEILDLLRRHWPDFAPARWTRLYRALQFYLRPMGEDGAGLIAFFHDQLRFAVFRHFFGMSGPNAEPARSYRLMNALLAEVFQTLAQTGQPATWQADRPRPLSELPYHRLRAGEADLLADLLMHFPFLEAKTAAGLVFEVADDLAAAAAALPTHEGTRENLLLLEEALRRDIHFIDRHRQDYPQALFQCLWNSAWWYDASETPAHYDLDTWEVSEPLHWQRRTVPLSHILEHWRKEKLSRQPDFAWLRSLRPPEVPLGSAQRAVLRGHQLVVYSVAWSPDGQHLVTGSLDSTARIWDSRNGQELLCLRGHRERVHAVCYSPDGNCVVTGSEDATVRTWNADTGRLLLCFAGHEKSVTGVDWSPSGDRIASGSWDGTVRVWDAHRGQQLLCVRGHADSVHSVRFSRDGIRILTASYDKTVRVWDSRSGQQQQCLTGHGDGVVAAEYSPDGEYIVSGSRDRSVRLWYAQNGVELRRLQGHEGGVMTVHWSPDGNRVVSGAQDRTLRVWDVSSGQQLFSLAGHEGQISGVRYSPDGLRLASSAWDNTVRLWGAERPRLSPRLRGHSDEIRVVSCSPDGRQIATGSSDASIRLWDRATSLPLFTLQGHGGDVTSVNCSPDGSRVVSGSWDRTVRVWDGHTGEELLRLQGHEGNVTAVAYSPDGRMILSGSEDNTVRLWEARTGRHLFTLQGHTGKVLGVACLPAGDRVVSSSEDRSVRVWDPNTGGLLRSLLGHGGEVRAVCCLPDGKRIASASQDKTVRVWEVNTGREMFCLKGHEWIVAAVAASPRGNRIASASWDRTVRVWDSRTGQQLHCLRGHTSYATGVAFPADGKRILSTAEDKTIRMWDIDSGRQLLALSGHEDSIAAAAWFPDGTRIVSGSKDVTIRFWDARTGAERRCLQGHRFNVTCVCFTPDGTRLVTGSFDQTLRIWDLRSRQQLRCLRGHTSSIDSVCCSADGSRLASGSWDKTVRVWDAQTGRELRCITGHQERVTAVCFSPDTSRIASGSDDGTLRVWDPSSGKELLRMADHGARLSYSSDGKRLVSNSVGVSTRIWDALTGRCLDVLPGWSDVAGMAAGPPSYPLRASATGLETVLSDHATGAPVAWFSLPLNSLSSSPGGRTWAGSSGNTLWVFTREGTAGPTF